MIKGRASTLKVGLMAHENCASQWVP